MAAEFLKYRTFSSTSELRTSIGDSANFAYDAMSIFGMFRLGDDSINRPMLVSNGSQIDLYYSAGDDAVRFYNNTSDQGSPLDTNVSTGWVIAGFTKNATGTMRWHQYVVSTGTWSHSDNGTQADTTMPSSDTLYHWSGSGWWWIGDAVCSAIWTTDLTDGQVEALAHSFYNWSAVPPKHLWRYEDTVVDDLIGTADQTVNTGSTVSSTYSPLSISGAKFSDDFNRANGALGSNYVAPVGATTPTIVMPVISSNVVVPSAEDANNAAMMASGTYGTDQWSMVRCKLGVDYSEVCAMTQMADTDDFYFGVWTTDGTHPSFPGFGTVNGPAFQLYRMVNASTTSVLADVAAPAPDGNFHRLKLVTNDRVFTLWFDGVRVLGPFDDSGNTGVALTGRPGFSMHRGDAGANPEIDEFSCGDFAGAAIPTPTLTSFTPSTVSLLGGTSVAVVGTGFIADSTMVTVDGVKCAVTVTSNTTGTFTSPASTAGVKTVTLTTPGGTTSSVNLTLEIQAPTLGNICEAASGAPALHTSMTVDAPSDFTGAANQGTLLWCLAASVGGADPNITPPAGKGFVPIGAVLHNTDLVASNSIHIWTQGFWSPADVSADSTFTVTFASSYVSRVAVATVNGTSGTATMAQANIAGAGAINLPSVTTTADKSLVLSIGLVDGGGTMSTPSGYTLATASPDIAYCYEWWAVQATAGATPTTSTTSTTTTTTIVATTAFAPVTAVATVPAAPTGLERDAGCRSSCLDLDARK